MRHTPALEKAIESAQNCDCIICNSTLANLRKAERLWKLAKGERGEWYRGLWRVNWKAACQSLVILEANPKKHLRGAPDVTYKFFTQAK